MDKIWEFTHRIKGSREAYMREWAQVSFATRPGHKMATQYILRVSFVRYYFLLTSVQESAFVTLKNQRKELEPHSSR